MRSDRRVVNTEKIFKEIIKVETIAMKKRG